jgi:hypothetical protein
MKSRRSPLLPKALCSKIIGMIKVHSIRIVKISFLLIGKFLKSREHLVNAQNMTLF